MRLDNTTRGLGDLGDFVCILGWNPLSTATRLRARFKTKCAQRGRHMAHDDVLGMAHGMLGTTPAWEFGGCVPLGDFLRRDGRIIWLC